MDKIKVLLVDDEDRAINSLQTLLNEYFPEVEILGTARNVPEAVLKINELRPELLFLDIEMPEYNGFELLKFFRDIDFSIIFVTAYSEYALKAFEVSAVDYILKPLELDALRKAVEKYTGKKEILHERERYETLKSNLEHAQVDRIALPLSDGLEFIKVAEIVALEADGAYTYVNTEDNRRMLVSKKLKFFEDLLEGRDTFYRPHRSYLINLNYMKKYLKGEGTILMDGDLIISISREKKADFEAKLRELKIMK